MPITRQQTAGPRRRSRNLGLSRFAHRGKGDSLPRACGSRDRFGGVSWVVLDSLIVTLEPSFSGGVLTMQNAMSIAHRRLGLHPYLGFMRQGRRERWSPAIHETFHAGQASVSTGYLPMIEYLNYLFPAVRLRPIVKRFPIVQVVTGI